MCRYFLIFAASFVARGTCEVILTSKALEKRWNSATLIFYGPQAADMTATAVYLQGDTLCSQSKLLAEDSTKGTDVDVSGKVVVFSYTDTLCRTHDVYEAMMHAGAAGIVLIEPWDPPGVIAYRRNDWGQSRYAHRTQRIIVPFHLNKDVFL